VFAIGPGLREARERQGLALEQAAAATSIQERHLRALEEERLERLPEPVYVRAFLREYATFLGLEPKRFLDEYAERVAAAEPPAPPDPPRRPHLPNTRLTGGVAVALAVAVVVAVLAWRFGGSSSRHVTAEPVVVTPPAAKPRSRPPPKAVPRPHPAPTRVVAPTLARLVLHASAGSCWIEAHADTSAGKQLYVGTLAQGQTLRLHARRIWMRVGAPSALTATLGGRAVALPHTTANLLVTPSGIRTG
jgi:hypothetical protein